ncbi:hypothetical protein [Klebsiella aerogenes]|uniref:hypothetical protein n=1 Tax=Klebsiella aerogenes TaxID=548 RepID=UPI001BCDB227|nr:hypothetical protein [Klebsiella aerogenes]HEM8654878.1 hypothetical protein [Klebsiella aerogenes]
MTSEELQKLLSQVNRVKDEADKADSAVEELEENTESHRARDGKTRSTLTLTFMVGFFSILVFSCLFVMAYNWAAVYWAIDLKKAGLVSDNASVKFLEVDKILSIMIGALGTSLGFIIGYYFKEKKM